MKKLGLLQYAGKEAGQAFSAQDWNNFVKDIADSFLPEYKTMKVEQRAVNEGVLSDWTDITEGVTNGQLQAGGTYRLSGYFPNGISIIGTAAKTKVYLNGCFIKADIGSCLNYTLDSKSLVVIVNPNTENYLIQTAEGTGSEYDKIGVIHSENNLTITGAGFLYLENVKGHGVKASELELRGNNTIVVNVQHDAFHGSHLLDLYHGNYYIAKCNDPFGSGTREAGETTKMRGIIRVFGGNIHVYKMGTKDGNSARVFDAKFSNMTLGSDDNYYSNDQELGSGVTASQVFNSGLHTLKYIVDGPAITSANIFSSSFGFKIPTITKDSTSGLPKTTGQVFVGGTDITEDTDYFDSTNNAYTIADEEAIVTVKGVVVAAIVFNTTKTQVTLEGGVLIAPYEGTYKGIAVKYLPTSSNVQIETTKGTEGNYIFGKISSGNNVKFTPKGSTALHIYPALDGLFGADNAIEAADVTIMNGAGSIYVSNANIGILGRYIAIGNDEKTGTKRKDPFEGDLYVEDNVLDMQVLLNDSDPFYTKKGHIHVTFDLVGNAFIDTILTTVAPNIASGEESGVIVGETAVDVSEPAVVREAGRLYYKKNLGAVFTYKDAAIQYSDINGDRFIKALI